MQETNALKQYKKVVDDIDRIYDQKIEDLQAEIHRLNTERWTAINRAKEAYIETVSGKKDE